MKDGAQLQAIMDVLLEINEAAQPADAVIANYFRGHRYIGSKDRAKISAALYDILRHMYRLNWWVDELFTKKPAAEERIRAGLILYLSLLKKYPGDAINAVFSGGKYAPAALDDDEVAFLGKLEGRTLIHPNMNGSIRLECPPWAYALLKPHMGDALENEMRAMQEPASLDIRINPIKTTRDDVLRELSASEIKAKATPFSPYGIRIEGRPPLSQMALFKDGRIEVQDEGSQILSLMLGAESGMSVVDFCAGAGGKTLAIAAQMNNKGRVVACDVAGKRLEKAKLRFRRAGLHNIETHELNNENDQWVKRNAGKYDRVLIDAPCSGTGTWRRNPDARWKQLGPSLDELLAMQGRILQSASRLVKTGGRLVYATCSLLQEENQKQIAEFLEKNGSFKLVPLDAAMPAYLKKLAKGDMLTLTPAQHKTDGFFAAVLEKAE
ncbi:MAG: RsmB/NOP family class I SAM-dependent RNA methyltransferase [Alphaproteobacteria bacterium]|nr:RsmB/NOP family class I SAM-dependent RNA methyltransferase [Alphaproteobacteria bacterium]